MDGNCSRFTPYHSVTKKTRGTSNGGLKRWWFDREIRRYGPTEPTAQLVDAGWWFPIVNCWYVPICVHSLPKMRRCNAPSEMGWNHRQVINTLFLYTMFDRFCILFVGGIGWYNLQWSHRFCNLLVIQHGYHHFKYCRSIIDKHVQIFHSYVKTYVKSG